MPERNSRHILGLRTISEERFRTLLNNSLALAEISNRDIKKTPALRGKTVINFFCEASTRTRTSFEIAAKWLSADAINVAASSSSLKKGESLIDSLRTLEAMRPDVIVVRHQDAGVPYFMAKYLRESVIINAGDGMHEHPTQGLLDCVSLIQHFGSTIDDLKGKKVAIVGDIVHSRVARSNIWAHHLLGNQVNLIGPPTFLPTAMQDSFPSSVNICHSLREGLEGADIIMCLRLQLERQNQHFIPSLEEYTNEYFVTRSLLDEVANDNYVVMHPGPVNRGVEVESELIDSEDRSLLTKQVTNGLAVRMACLIDACTTEKMEIEEMSEVDNVIN